MHDDVSEVLANRKPWATVETDAVALMDGLPADSVSLVMCSPPYEKARLYLEGGKDLKVARGTEDWVAWMLTVCAAARRVCTGLCVFVVEGQTKDYRYSSAPFLLVADLHRGGFHLRKPPVYRRVGIPGSGGEDWLRNDYELCVCFARGGKLPWSDNTACGHPPKFGPGGEMSHRVTDGTRVNQWGGHDRSSSQRRADGSRQPPGRPSHKFVKRGATRGYKDGDCLNEGVYVPPAIANPGNVIDCKAGGGQMGNRACHGNEAPYPEDLAAFFVRSFAAPGSVVLDPFSGSGTTGAVCVEWGRRFVGGDLRPSQVALSRKRIAAVTPPIPGLLPAAPGPGGGPVP
jgi:hypothetical protein